ncbi:MAG: S8 family serine peptidase [Candidatus Bipolaricaulis sp.]|nr:S8 family serine peptidase [Candidatus Bipolaricaulis sp.]
MTKRWVVQSGLIVGLALVVGGCSWLQPTSLTETAADPMQTIEVVVDGPLSDAIVAELAEYGQVTQRFDAIGGLIMRTKESALKALSSLPSVRVAGAIAQRHTDNYAGGISTWDLDLMNVTDPSASRVVEYDGTGVYVAVLDTGLVQNWREYLPEERIAVQYAKAFKSGASDNSTVAEATHQWERDTEAHGTHVTSTILGYWIKSLTAPYAVNGVAPMATVIPVKVLGNNGGGWSPAIAAGIVYAVDLKVALDAPMVINMSLGGSELSPLEAAAIDYAVDNGVVVVASAGNEGEAGMGYPGAYAPVVSVGAIGWVGEWVGFGAFWREDVPEPATIEALQNSVYVCDFSSRAVEDQDLDVLAPGSWIVGPYLGSGAATPPLRANGKPGEYYFLGGTSMASPHVAGLVALMFDKNPALAAADVEGILEGTAIDLPAGSRTVDDGSGVKVEFSWRDDATGAGIVLAGEVLDAVAP